MLDLDDSAWHDDVELPADVVSGLRSKFAVVLAGNVRASREAEGRSCLEAPYRGHFRVWQCGEGGFRVERGEPRDYAVSRLPVSSGRLEPRVALALYSHAVAAWTQLTDVRFKLLALVPAVSVVVWVQLLSESYFRRGTGAALAAGVAVGGFLITVALFLYDRRNDQLYDDLISRARRLEDDLGLDTGLFRGRRSKASRVVNHTTPVVLLYSIAAAGWLGVFGCLFSRCTPLPVP
jgi:hypothetical protein